MPDFGSPLRYPGGKAGIASLLAEIIRLNGLHDCVLVEPYAGGGGAAISLLLSEHVSHVILNDADRSIYAFWKSVLHRSTHFLSVMDDTPVTLGEWQHQRTVYRAAHRHSLLRLGFATFFLNRCNRSGIIGNGGPIGGQHQQGKWRIDARFNKDSLRRRIERIANYRERFSVYNLDAIHLLRTVVAPLSAKRPVFVYLDPPYYAKGPELYLNAYAHKDHARLAQFMQSQKRYTWVMTYDNVPEVRRLYGTLSYKDLSISYTAYRRRAAKEILIHPKDVHVPVDADAFITGSMSSGTGPNAM